MHSRKTADVCLPLFAEQAAKANAASALEAGLGHEDGLEATAGADLEGEHKPEPVIPGKLAADFGHMPEAEQVGHMNASARAFVLAGEIAHRTLSEGRHLVAHAAV